MDTRLSQEETRRIRQHEELKTRVEAKVDSRIEAEAQQGLAAEHEKLDAVAGSLRRKLIDEVGESERELRRLRRAARLSQLVNYVFGLVYALLALRFLLALMAARERAPFVRFVRSLTEPLYLPFKGIVASPATDTGVVLALPLLIALGAYALLHLAVLGLLRLAAQRKTEI